MNLFSYYIINSLIVIIKKIKENLRYFILFLGEVRGERQHQIRSILFLNFLKVKI